MQVQSSDQRGVERQQLFGTNADRIGIGGQKQRVVVLPEAEQLPNKRRSNARPELETIGDQNTGSNLSEPTSKRNDRPGRKASRVCGRSCTHGRTREHDDAFLERNDARSRKSTWGDEIDQVAQQRDLLPGDERRTRLARQPRRSHPQLHAKWGKFGIAQLPDLAHGRGSRRLDQMTPIDEARGPHQSLDPAGMPTEEEHLLARQAARGRRQRDGMAKPDFDRRAARHRSEQLDARGAVQHLERAGTRLTEAQEQARSSVVFEFHVVSRHRHLVAPEVRQHAIRESGCDEAECHVLESTPFRFATDPTKRKWNRTELKGLDQFDRIHAIGRDVSRYVICIDDHEFVGTRRDRLDQVIPKRSIAFAPANEDGRAPGEQATSGRDREPREPVPGVPIGRCATQDDRMSACTATRVFQGHRRQQVIEARFIAVGSEKRDEPVDRGKRDQEFPPDRDPPRVRLESLHTKAGLTGPDRLEQALSHVPTSLSGTDRRRTVLPWAGLTGPPKRAAREDEPSGGSGNRLASPTRKRVTLRPEIRAAMALEAAGELQEAARVFEYAGEYAQASILRLEHARTLRDAADRIDALREGCARNPGTTPESRALHLNLAEALLIESEHASDAARRRALELEAASALEEGGEGARAGELYESLGLLRRAATTYERTGEIAHLELVLEILERVDQHAASERQLEREIDYAIGDGRRRYAHSMLIEHVRSPASSRALALASAEGTFVRSASPSLITRLQLLESKLIHRLQIDLRWNVDRVTSIRAYPTFRIGRAPDAHLSLADARLSRHHVELALDMTSDEPRLAALDLGSKVGSFWNGEPIAAGEPCPLLDPGELALGSTSALEIHPVRGGRGHPIGAFIRARGAGSNERWTLFMPGGGPLWLAPDIRVPARLLFDRGFAILDFASRITAKLHGASIGTGASMELLVGDRIELVDAPLQLEVLA